MQQTDADVGTYLAGAGAAEADVLMSTGPVGKNVSFVVVVIVVVVLLLLSIQTMLVW